jgi:hypothetical protein
MNSLNMKNLTEPKPVDVNGELYYYSLSFDIDDFYGEGFYWLQIYDSDKQLMYDEKFADSFWQYNKFDVHKTIIAFLATYTLISGESACKELETNCEKT